MYSSSDRRTKAKLSLFPAGKTIATQSNPQNRQGFIAIAKPGGN
jgi:hypothetical protein